MAPSDAAGLTTTHTTGMMLADNTAMASTEIVATMTYGTVAMSSSNAAAVELARDLTWVHPASEDTTALTAI
jgi:hypothetical protein